jgi:hypothetical protein
MDRVPHFESRKGFALDVPRIDRSTGNRNLHCMATSIALLLYGAPGTPRPAAKEERFSKLTRHLVEKGFKVHTVWYHDTLADALKTELAKFAAILVWINPIEDGRNRDRLDALLRELSSQGCFVSAHPDTIVKMGTKDILLKTREEAFGSDVTCYRSAKEFREQFSKTLQEGGIRVLKQNRGNGGNGVYRVDASGDNNNRIAVLAATRESVENRISPDALYKSFEPFFETGGLLIDQPWNPNLANGMVRCYLSGATVAGFGYQEVNAFCPRKGTWGNPSPRYYFSEDCALFADLRKIMETSWLNRLRTAGEVTEEMLPVIWDADFFINIIHTDKAAEKYTLCEVNVSSVSPFPESAVPHIVAAVERKLQPA